MAFFNYKEIASTQLLSVNNPAVLTLPVMQLLILKT